MRLSDNFFLIEFTRSATAERLNIDNTPSSEQLENLKEITNSILQPVRNCIGPIRITSGYRNPDLSVAIGSKISSQHCKGQAVDIQFVRDGKMNNKLLLKKIIEICDFDQLIDEYDYSWIHVSHKCEGNRNQILKAYKENGQTKYADITQNFKSL
jgi:zinc D-Ala-D-Ala carboxypeptidase